MWNDKKYSVGAGMILAVALMAPAAWAYEEDESVDVSSPGHWYIGGATGYLRPDGNRGGGNTRTLGFQGGYQFNDRWSLELGYQQDAFGPGKDDLTMYDLEFTRYWGDQFRFLIEFGYTHIALDANSGDDATAGFHVGSGISAFVTPNIEVRGDAKLVHSQNEKNLDGVGALSVNWHFIRPSAVSEETVSVLGDSQQTQSVASAPYREPLEATPVVQEPAPSTVREEAMPVAADASTTSSASVAPAPIEEPAAPSAPAASVVSASAAQPAEFVAPTATPKAAHTLLNFGYNSFDVDNKYGSQLDQISEEIKSANAKAIVEGHTDDKGSAANNKILSLDRAIIVKRELKKRGVNGSDIMAVGRGEESPVASNDTEEGRAQNRRVEVKLYDK